MALRKTAVWENVCGLGLVVSILLVRLFNHHHRHLLAHMECMQKTTQTPLVVTQQTNDNNAPHIPSTHQKSTENPPAGRLLVPLNATPPSIYLLFTSHIARVVNCPNSRIPRTCLVSSFLITQKF